MLGNPDIFVTALILGLVFILGGGLAIGYLVVKFARWLGQFEVDGDDKQNQD